MSRQKKHEHVNHERWLVSYADFITLLFAFFVVLFASSQSDKKKVRQVEHSIQSAFQTMGIFPEMSTSPNLGGIAAGTAPAAGSIDGQIDITAKQLADLNRMKLRMEHLLAGEIMAHTVAINMGRDGLIITLREAGFFESGSADPLPTSMNTLNAIARAIAVTSYDVRIEGNTDNIPIHNDHFDSNWELSTARATVLARIFILQAHIAPTRLSAAGYAEFHPVASNTTAAGRSRNRRVDIIVLPDHHSFSQHSIQPPAALHATGYPPTQPALLPAAHNMEALSALAATRGYAPALQALHSSPPAPVPPRD